MKKSGPLTKVEKFYIENNLEIDAASLAKDLDRTITIVKHHIEDIKEIEDKNKPKGSVTKTRPNEARDGFARRRGAVVSTKTASEKAENLKKFKKNNKDGLFRPFSE